MYLDPLYERDKRTSAWFTQDIANNSFEFSWMVPEFERRNPIINLDFKNFSAISYEEENDYFVVNFTDPGKFFNLTAIPELRK